MSGDNTISIDGSIGEGGGEIIRNSIAYSTLMQKPLQVFKIRAGRSKPGLRPQHHKGILLVQELCNATLSDCQVESTEFSFNPHKITGGSFRCDIGTAGSISLLVQTCLPCLLYADKQSLVKISGGTHVAFSPQFEYMSQVLSNYLAKMGVRFAVELVKRGYYPKGGGQVCLSCEPVERIQPIVLENRGTIVAIKGRCFVAGVLPPSKANHLKSRVLEKLKASSFMNDNPSVTIELEALKETAAFGNASGVFLCAESDTGLVFGGSSLGERKLSDDEIADMAVEDLLESLRHQNSCVDQYMQDQLVIFMALADGKSKIVCGPLTKHTETAIEIAEQLTSAKFQISPHDKAENHVEISCNGIGLLNNNLIKSL